MSRGADFWSRRRATVAREEAAEAEAAEEATREKDMAALEKLSDEDICAELDLPNPDDLKPGQDIAAFMQKSVPERLRRRALRQLWRLNPVLANLDGLNDYDGDYTDAAMVKPGMKTAYQVGKGMLRHVQALAEAEAAKAEKLAQTATAPETVHTEAEKPDELSQENAVANQGPETLTTTMVVTDEPPSPTLELDTSAVRPRRMRFAFDQEHT